MLPPPPGLPFCTHPARRTASHSAANDGLRPTSSRAPSQGSANEAGSAVGRCTALRSPERRTPEQCLELRIRGRALKASTDPAVLAEGKYLFEADAHCQACHTAEHDYTTAAALSDLPPSGGHEWHMGPMGTLRSVNITSDVETGIGGMSDADLARVLKKAVRPNGEPAIMMVGVGPMADEDTVALMSYLRSLPPVKKVTPRSDISVMGKTLFPLVARAYLSPKPDWDLPPRVPEGEVSVERGAYLANGPAYCFACHSELNLSAELEVVEPRFSGCTVADPDPEDSSMVICAPNLTPHPTAGHITGWDEEAFVSRLGAGRGVKNSPMPWESYRLLTDADKRSLYRYLRTLEPADRVTGPPHRPGGWKPG